MADEMEEVVVTSQPLKGKRKFPLSPLQAGIAGTLAASPSGPLAPVIGLGTALITKLAHKNFNDDQTEYINSLNDELDSTREVISNERAIADPDEQRQLDNASQMIKAGYIRLAADPKDDSGRVMIQQGRAIVTGLIGGDIEQRKQEEAAEFQMQRNLIGETAKRYQSQYQNATETYQNAEKAASQIIDFLNQPDFDPNKPINKAHLADLVSMGGLMFRDVPDSMDALTQGAGSLGAFGARGQAAGEAIGGLATYIKSQDFKINPSDFYKFAVNLKNYAAQYTKQELEQLGRQSQNLEVYARQRKVLPEGLSVADFVSGGEKELKTNPTPELFSPTYTDPKERQRIERLLPPTAEQIRAREAAKRGVIRRPTN